MMESDVIFLDLFVSSKKVNQAMTALSTYLWHSAQPRDSCYAWSVRCLGRVRDTPWMWRLQFQSSTIHPAHPTCPPLCAFAKKVGIIHWHKSFTDLFFPLEQLVSNGIQQLQLSNISEKQILCNPLVFPKCRELETLLTDPLWNLLRSWASLGARPGW